MRQVIASRWSLRCADLCKRSLGAWAAGPVLGDELRRTSLSKGYAAQGKHESPRGAGWHVNNAVYVGDELRNFTASRSTGSIRCGHLATTHPKLAGSRMQHVSVRIQMLWQKS